MTHCASRVAQALVAVGLVFATFAAPALSKTRVSFTRLAGFPAPGTPAQYNKVGALKIGAPSARNLLLVNPGTSASAAYFAPLAKTIVKDAPNWQVWAVERRENLLEDQSRLDQAKARTITAKQAFDYYLGYLADSSITTHFVGIPDADVAYAKQWGMHTQSRAGGPPRHVCAQRSEFGEPEERLREEPRAVPAQTRAEVGSAAGPYSAIATYFVSRYSSMPSGPPSRPKPECLTPPNGAAALETIPWLRPTMPVSRPSMTRKARPRSRV
jgi:hypothetical protein